jgi:AP-1-like factor
MLNEAKQRNDHLSHAYTALHDEYVQLKTSQLKEQQQQQQQQTPSHHLATAYGGGDLVFDPTMVGMATNNDRLDMDLYVYTGLGTGMHSMSM